MAPPQPHTHTSVPVPPLAQWAHLRSSAFLLASATLRYTRPDKTISAAPERRRAEPLVDHKVAKPAWLTTHSWSTTDLSDVGFKATGAAKVLPCPSWIVRPVLLRFYNGHPPTGCLLRESHLERMVRVFSARPSLSPRRLVVRRGGGT